MHKQVDYRTVRASISANFNVLRLLDWPNTRNKILDGYTYVIHTYYIGRYYRSQKFDCASGCQYQ